MRERKKEKTARICRFEAFSQFRKSLSLFFRPLSFPPEPPEAQFEQAAAGRSLVRRTSSAEKVLPSLHIQTRERETISPAPFFVPSSVVVESFVGVVVWTSSSLNQTPLLCLFFLRCCVSSSRRAAAETIENLASLEREGATCCPKNSEAKSSSFFFSVLFLLQKKARVKKPRRHKSIFSEFFLFFFRSRFVSAHLSPLLPPFFRSRWAEEEADEEAEAEAAEASPRSAGAAEAVASTRSGRAALPMQEEAGASPAFFSIRINSFSLAPLAALSISLTHEFLLSFSLILNSHTTVAVAAGAEVAAAAEAAATGAAATTATFSETATRASKRR